MTPEEIRRFINSRADEYNLSIQDTLDAYETFNNVMSADKNKNLDDRGQVILLDQVIHQVSHKVDGVFREFTNEQIEDYLGENTHMIFYDNFLEFGESKKIREALHNYGKTVDILKGVTGLSDHHVTINGIKVDINVVSSEKISPYISEMTLTDVESGEKIYTWSREFITDYIPDDEKNKKDIVSTVEGKPKKQKAGSFTEYIRSERIIDRETSDYTVRNVYIYHRKDGTDFVQYRDTKGRIMGQWKL